MEQFSPTFGNSRLTMIWTKCTKKVISLQLTQLDLEFIPDFAQEKTLAKMHVLQITGLTHIRLPTDMSVRG